MQQDNAIAMRELTTATAHELAGYTFTGVGYDERLKAPVFTFTEPYKGVNRDILFFNGALCLGEIYGQTTDREKLYYIKMG